MLWCQGSFAPLQCFIFHLYNFILWLPQLCLSICCTVPALWALWPAINCRHWQHFSEKEKSRKNIFIQFSSCKTMLCLDCRWFSFSKRIGNMICDKKISSLRSNKIKRWRSWSTSYTVSQSSLLWSQHMCNTQIFKY